MRVNFPVTNICVCCGALCGEGKSDTINPFIVERLTGIHDTFIPCHSVTCDNCGSMFQDIRYTDEQMARLYRDYRSEDYIALRERYFPDYREMNKWFDNQVPYMDKIETLLAPYLTFPVTILDYGGDTGINAPFYGKRVLEVYDIGTNHINTGERVVKPAGAYDLIVCANVLEHVSYPLKTLSDIMTHMDKDSILYVEIPEDGVSPNGWMEHLTLFTGKGLDLLFERRGLELVDMDEVRLSIADFPVHQIMMVLKRKDCK